MPEKSTLSEIAREASLDNFIAQMLLYNSVTCCICFCSAKKLLKLKRRLIKWEGELKEAMKVSVAKLLLPSAHENMST